MSAFALDEVACAADGERMLMPCGKHTPQGPRVALKPVGGCCVFGGASRSYPRTQANRAATQPQYDSAIPNQRMLTKVPVKPHSMIGRLPYWSDRRPVVGMGLG